MQVGIDPGPAAAVLSNEHYSTTTAASARSPGKKGHAHGCYR
jgi:hypothetical protein